MKFDLRPSAIIPLAIVVSTVCAAARLPATETVKAAPAATHAPQEWKDIEGQSFTAAEITMRKATVFVFASTQCPISNIYMPRVSELARDAVARGVRFFLVDPSQEDTPAALRRYGKDRGLSCPIVRDTGLALTDWLAANRTPEGIVVDSKGDICYRGRIDDNPDRVKVVHHDLRDAIDAVLNGTKIDRPRTLSVGCTIFRDTVPTAHAGQPKITYARDIAPILNKNCVVCHRTGEAAPFALQTYRQARTWAAAVRDYTVRRIMPPWKAVPGAGDFHDARALSEFEIDRIAHWVDVGAPEGNPKDLPPAPVFPDPAAWSLGKPDLVLQPARPYHLAAEGPDVYRNFVLPVDFQLDRFVSAMEFKPGNRAVVHHIVLYIDLTAQSVRLDGKESEPGYTVPGTGVGLLLVDWGEVWVPGRTPRLLPPGVAVKIPKGAKLVMQVHYHKNGAPQVDTSQVALFYSRGRVQQVMRTVPVTNAAIELQPGDSAQRLKIEFALTMDAHLHTIFPHMHLLGREMRVTANLPDGDKKTLPLITVNDWDFNWQETYAYKDPVALPKGTRITIEAVYDNSESNPRQAHHPAQVVRWGEQTTDEMCVCVLGFTFDKEQLGIDLGSPPGGI